MSEGGGGPASAMVDVVVVGGGPAGLAAALVLGRARLRVLVVDDGQPRNAASAALHGFPTRDGTPPLELLRLTRAEVESYGVEVRAGRVVSARVELEGAAGSGARPRRRPTFHLTVESGEVLRARRLLLATGVTDQLPEVDGMRRYYGKGVFHCPYCDGWEVRDRRLVAFGPTPRVARLALHLLAWSPQVVACTQGQPLGREYRRKLRQRGVELVEEPVARLEGGEGEDGRLERLVLASGRTLPADALFLSVDRVQHSALPEALGCKLDEKGAVRVKGAQHTGVPGLYLAGDAAGDVQFAVVAAAEGARAAVAIHKDLEREDGA